MIDNTVALSTERKTCPYSTLAGPLQTPIAMTL